MMKIGDLVRDKEAPDIGVGIVTIVRECMVEGKLTDALSIETYWPKLCGTYAAFKMNNTHGPWFSLEVVNEANLS